MMKHKKADALGNLEGMLRGLGDLVEKLAETSQQIKRSGVFDVDVNSGQKAKASYGFSVTSGLNDDAATPDNPPPHIRANQHDVEVSIKEIAEPLVDVIEEQDCLLVLAEMPGVADADVQLELNGDVLILQAETGSKKYYTEIVLPRSFDNRAIQRSCHHGILEVKLNFCTDDV